MGRRTLLLVASVMIAAVGAGLIALWAVSAQSRADASVKGVSIMVVTSDYKAGTTLNSIIQVSGTTEVKVPAAFAAKAVTPLNTAALAFQQLSMPIVAGTPLRTTMFSTVPVRHSDLSNGYGITVPVANNSLVQAGDLVALYLTSPNSKSGKPYLVATSVHVTGTQPGFLALDVTQDEAGKIMQASAVGPLQVAALGPKVTATTPF